MNVCLDEGYKQTDENVCYSSDQLAAVNPKPPMTGSSTAQAAIDALLCVNQKNYAFEGEFYPNVGLQSASIFSTAAGQKQYNYLSKPSTTTTPDPYYDQNDTIPVFFNSSSSSGIVPLGAGYLAVPQPDFSGHCNDFNYAHFEVPVSSSCVRHIQSSSLQQFRDYCENSLSIDALVNKILIGRQANLISSTNVPSSALVQVNIGLVLYQSLDTGVVTDVTGSWGGRDSKCQTQLRYISSLNISVCGLDPDTTFFNESSTDSVCFGAVSGLSYVIHHDQSTQASITSVVANLILTSVPYGAARSFEQSFGIRFVDSGAPSTRSSSNGNLVNRTRSGNPGYVRGSQVLLAIAAQNASAPIVQEFVGGLSVPTPATTTSSLSSSSPDECPSWVSLSLYGQTTVQFGSDLVTSCSIRLNISAFKHMCCVGSGACTGLYNSQYSNAAGVPMFLVPQSGYIGIYGNADPLDKSQWLSLATSSAAVSTRRWSDAARTCTNMAAGLNYKFLVAKTGELNYPQAKIVAASADYMLADWAWTGSPASQSATQLFTLTITVSFITTDLNGLTGYTPPPPPSLFQVPYDVFYPFTLDTFTSSATRVPYGPYVGCWLYAVTLLVTVLVAYGGASSSCSS